MINKIYCTNSSGLVKNRKKTPIELDLQGKLEQSNLSNPFKKKKKKSEVNKDPPQSIHNCEEPYELTVGS